MLLSDWYAHWKEKRIQTAVEEAKAKGYEKGYVDGRYDEIIFSPDPRTDQNELIGVDDDSEHDFISIQLGSDSKFGIDASHSAVLERREDGFYELCLFNLEKEHYEPFRVFNDTYNVKTVCDQVEQLFEDGHLQVHVIEEREKPLLIPGEGIVEINE